MTSLDPAAGHLILINTFTVAAERADDLVELLSRATEETMQHLPGFVSANLHVALDRTRVTNYAQWRSLADFEAMRANPAAQVHMREAAGIALSFDPALYELRHTLPAN